MSRINIVRFITLALLFAVAAWYILDTNQVHTKKTTSTQLPFVESIAATAANHKLTLSAFGNVQAAQSLTVKPQLKGQLLELHKNFEPGGTISAGEILFKIDPSDYQLQLNSAKNSVSRASADLAIEKAKGLLAENDYKRLKGSKKSNPKSRALALRKPQLKQAQASLSEAQNQLQLMQLQLSRTQLSLPYDVVVTSRKKVAGEILKSGESIGQVIRADVFWVELQLEALMLKHIVVKNENNAGSLVSIKHADFDYPAEVIRTLATINKTSRLAGVLVEIHNPLHQSASKVPLLIGTYVEARINAGTIKNVIRIPNQALHNNSRVWIIDQQNKLQVRKVDVLYTEKQHLLISHDNFDTADRIVLGSVDGLVPGSEVRFDLH